MKIAVFTALSVVALRTCQAVALQDLSITTAEAETDVQLLTQTGTEIVGAVMGALGGGGGGGGGGPSGGCAQNTPAINIIDNARIMMMPGNIPMGGSIMAQDGAESADETSNSSSFAQSETTTETEGCPSCGGGPQQQRRASLFQRRRA